MIPTFLKIIGTDQLKYSPIFNFNVLSFYRHHINSFIDWLTEMNWNIENKFEGASGFHNWLSLNSWKLPEEHIWFCVIFLWKTLTLFFSSCYLLLTRRPAMLQSENYFYIDPSYFFNSPFFRDFLDNFIKKF